MDRFDLIGVEDYLPAEEVKKLSFLKNLQINISIFARLLPRICLCTIFFVFYAIRGIYRIFLPLPLKNLNGKLALVTGGGNGIGRALCFELARKGCHIACADIDFKAAEATSTELRRNGVNAFPYKVDVSVYQEICDVKVKIEQDMGIVDILVNNAGLLPILSVREGSPKDIQKLVHVNFLAHIWTIRVFIDGMIKKGDGHIVAIASLMALFPYSRCVAYAATKYGVRGLMEALTMELNDDKLNIKTLLVCPHLTNTRKYFTDYVRTSIGNDTLSRIGLQTPKDVAVQTVKAIRNGSHYVTVPSYYLILWKISQAFPFGWLKFVYGFLPKLPAQKIEPLTLNV